MKMKVPMLAGMALATGFATADELREVPLRFDPNFKCEVTPRHEYAKELVGNPRIKRACDKDPLDSVRWVMNEGRTKYHTSVSLHLNMLDAYPDSDLFETYLKEDIIAKDRDGKPIEGEWGYKISYPQEWAKGYAQKRLDRLLALLPVRETGTLHIDAFHCQAPIGYVDAQGRPYVRMQSPISPYLKFTRQDDIDAQKKIIKYLDERGVDVTEEGCTQEAGDQLVGVYVPMLYHYGSDLCFRYPRTVLGGANYNGAWNRVFGRSFNTEAHFQKYGWCGTYALPRTLWLRSDGTLGVAPVEELKALRGKGLRLEDLTLNPGSRRPLAGIRGDCCELELTIPHEAAGRVALDVRADADSGTRTTLGYDEAAGEIYFDATAGGSEDITDFCGHQPVERAPFRLSFGEDLVLRVFVDGPVVEVFANDRQAISRRVYAGSTASGVFLLTRGAECSGVTVRAWNMSALEIQKFQAP